MLSQRRLAVLTTSLSLLGPLGVTASFCDSSNPPAFSFQANTEALAAPSAIAHFSSRWPWLISFLRSQSTRQTGCFWVIATHLGHANKIPLLIDPETNHIFDLAADSDLFVRLTGSLARRMVWGQKPWHPASDLDLLVDFPESESDRQHLFSKIEVFKKNVHRAFPNLYIDIVNEPHRLRSSARHVTVNLLRIERHSGRWIISDGSDGKDVADAVNRTVRFQPGHFPLRLADLFKLLKISEDARGSVQIDRHSWKDIRTLAAQGLLKTDDPTSSLKATVANYHQNDFDAVEALGALFGNFLSTLIKSSRPEKLIATLRGLPTPIGDFAFVLDQLLDVTTAVKRTREAQRTRTTLTYRSFDDLFRHALIRQAARDLAPLDSSEDLLARWVLPPVALAMSDRERVWLEHFFKHELYAWMSKANLEPVPNRMTARRALSKMINEVLFSKNIPQDSLFRLASMVSIFFGDHLRRHWEPIMRSLSVDNDHLLNYYGQSWLARDPSNIKARHGSSSA